METSTLLIGGGVAIALVIAVIVLLVRGARSARTAGRLTVTRGPRQGETFEIVRDRTRTRIGALDDNDIVLPSKQVSRYHAEVRVRAGRVQVWDLQARNGTLVNGERIKTHELRPGDIITIGDAELRYDR